MPNALITRVVGLTVDHFERPLGLENLHPRFSWRLESTRRNVRQSAYRILVASNEWCLAEGHGDLWDSGCIQSRRCIGIQYEGQPLISRQRCWWRVQVWDERGEVTESSDLSSWEMGLLSPSDWQAQWLAVDDAIAQADRETALEWMWGGAQDNRNAASRSFELEFFLPTATHGGVLFACRRTYEKVADVRLDGISISVTYPDRDMTREILPLGPLSSGTHRLVIEVHCRSMSEHQQLFGEPPPKGLAVFGRFDGVDGSVLRVGSGNGWTTTVDGGIKSPVTSVPVKSRLVVEAAMHLRRSFSVEKTVECACLYATALGCYEARLNGHRIGDALLTPEVSQYEKRVLYRVYDVKRLLKMGTNALGFTVGDGWYAAHPAHEGRYPWGPPPRRLLAQLELTYSDGTRDVIATNPSWRINRSPIQQSDFVQSEIYDARLELTDWDLGSFDDSSWQHVQLAANPPCRLAAQVTPPIRATQVLTVQAITSPQPSVYVFDFGQNFAGWCRLHVKADAGARIDLRFAEQLKACGEIDQFSLGAGKAVDTYIARGDRQGETFEPHFTYHGFRYVQVTGLPTAPSIDSLEGIVIHSDLKMTGRLRVNHPLIEQLWRNIVWTQRSNMVGIATDCPNRSERMGWFGDAAMFLDAATFNMDMAAFSHRQMDDARDHQYPTGAFAPIAPKPLVWAEFKVSDGTAHPTWSDAGVIIPWVIWRRYADRRIVEENWEAMERYLNFILERNPNYLWLHGRGPDIGDWLAIGDNYVMRPETGPSTPLELMSTAYWALSADLLAQMAEVTGRTSHAQRLHEIRQQIRNAFIERFVHADGKVGNGSQTSYLLALAFDLVPEELRCKAVEHLVADIRSRGCALSTGIVGTQYLLDVLTEAGYADVAYDLLLRTEYPSWGFMIAQGATTIWERWDGSLDKNYLTASHNHCPLGSVGGFLFRHLAGIDAASPGFESITIRPVLDPRVKKAGADYDSAMGRISTDWEQLEDGRFRLDVIIPANTKARIHLPVKRKHRIEEDGQQIMPGGDSHIVGRSDHEAVIETGSGSYQFIVS